MDRSSSSGQKSGQCFESRRIDPNARLRGAAPGICVRAWELVFLQPLLRLLIELSLIHEIPMTYGAETARRNARGAHGKYATAAAPLDPFGVQPSETAPLFIAGRRPFWRL